MERIIKLIEDELERLEKEVDYLRWENAALKKELKEAKAAKGAEDGQV